MKQPHPQKPLEKVPGHSLLIVRLIAAGKLFKALTLVALAIALHYVIAPDSKQELIEYADVLRPGTFQHYLHYLLERVLAMSPATVQFLRLGFFIYAGLYLTEGLGLLFDKAWAEWMLVITTAGFLPIEIYEIIERPSLVRCLIFALNIAMLVYITLRLRWRHLAKIEARRQDAPVVSRNTTPSGIKP